MEAPLYSQMLADKDLYNLKRMQYKYSGEDVSEMLRLMRESMLTSLPILDFKGQPVVYMDSIVHLSMRSMKVLLMPQVSTLAYGVQAMEDEIHNTLKIENINSSRDSIRRILDGYSPIDESENRILGMKRGLDFISERSHMITEENLYYLYQMAVEDFLPADDRLPTGKFYRHDSVYIVGGEVEHEGLPHKKLPEYMSALINFIDTDTGMNELIKAALIHFYIAYIHPYFDGNGRIARFMHLWYLVQHGYASAMFVPFSSYINASRGKYYKAYRQIEENEKISGFVDATPFLVYFADEVYNKLGNNAVQPETLTIYSEALSAGEITPKEKDLWNFVLSTYGKNEFSTKQLELDYRDAAYATIRTFVMKFEKLGLLTKHTYGNRPRYCVGN